MKRILFSLLVLLLVLGTLLTSCKNADSSKNNGTAPGGGAQSPSKENAPVYVTENYVPTNVYEQMKSYFESTESGFSAYEKREKAPFVSTDVFTLSDCKVKSITIPVFSTGKADKSGNFTFSIYVLPNGWAALRNELAAPEDPIVINVNAKDHELTENQIVRKFIKVDLTEYNITLSDDETLGFSNDRDTLIPAQVLTKGTVGDSGLQKHTPAKYMIDTWDVVGYYYYDPETDPDTGKVKGFSHTDNSLFFDFELERCYQSQAAYEELLADKAQADADYAEKLAAVKTAYTHKCFSLIGDSISTFNGVTNNAATHPSLSENRVYYTINTTVYDYTKTYWGKLSKDTGMDLCVINSWSGSKVYGDKDDLVDNMLTRSYALSTAAGKTPDVIFLYYGINDMLNSPSSVNGTSEEDYTGNLPTGDLYQRLSAENKTKTDKEIVGEWFTEVRQLANDAGYNPDDATTVKRGETYITWEAAYALSLQNIKRLYGNAEVYCFTLAECNHGSSGQPRQDKANVILRALAEYFEVGLVDQSNCEINKRNCHVYTRDAHGLHPNGKGHAAITKLIVETLYEKLPK